MRHILSLLAFVPVASFAVGGNLAGSGTKADPWQVADYEDLKKVGETPYTMNGQYLQQGDNDRSWYKGFHPLFSNLHSRQLATDQP